MLESPVFLSEAQSERYLETFFLKSEGSRSDTEAIATNELLPFIKSTHCYVKIDMWTRPYKKTKIFTKDKLRGTNPLYKSIPNYTTGIFIFPKH